MQDRSATKIQARCRGFLAEEQYFLYVSSRKIQTRWKAFYARDEYVMYMAGRQERRTMRTPAGRAKPS